MRATAPTYLPAQSSMWARGPSGRSELAGRGGFGLDGLADGTHGRVRAGLDGRFALAAQSLSAFLGDHEHCPQRFVAALAEQAEPVDDGGDRLFGE